MPVYDFQCPAGHVRELNVPYKHFLDDYPLQCMECSKPMKRKFSVPAIILKGKGFYSTDNRKKMPD